MDLIEGIKTHSVRSAIDRNFLWALWEMDLIEGIKTYCRVGHILYFNVVLWEMDLIEGIKTNSKSSDNYIVYN